ncbi:MAG: primosomal protein N' [candidate division Zixibacteria bacterium RBG_16_53_22]|nr:MAG: primosomal protein N' [candidate division Zixibacteria bacterium RBG_16_53_22]
MEGIIVPGMLAVVPFRRQASIGVIWELTEDSDLPSENVRDLSALGDVELMVPDELLQMVRHICRQYIATPGMVLKSALPPGTLTRRKLYFYPGPKDAARDLDSKTESLLSLIREEPGRWSYSDLAGIKGLDRAAVDTLVKSGVLLVSPFKAGGRTIPRGKERWINASLESTPESLKPGSNATKLLRALQEHSDGIPVGELRTLGFSTATAAALAKKGLAEYQWREKKLVEIGAMKSLPREDAVVLTLWQEAALTGIKSAIDSGKHRGFLLYGVTSSGKTQVYLEAVAHALSMGKSALVLVPEISLTPQIIARFERHLGNPPLVWHSHLSPTERAIVYRAASSGRARVIIGTRSAIFSPLRNLGLIVVDEEQDHSFKQDDPSPRYNARDVALERAKIIDATVVYGSATPSAEIYQMAKTGRLDLLTLPQRVAGFGPPRIELISTAFKTEPRPNEPPVFPRGFRPISEKLYQEITIRLKKREQIIILLNRRGYSSAVVCFDCGWVGKCPDCEIGWTYHKDRDRMVCHYCGKERRGPIACQRCGSLRLSFRSAGTQRLEETIRHLFPTGRAVRLDTDVAAGKWEARNVLDEFGRGKYQILFGTQMVAKGHHFPRVGLVGVISADIGLSLPDFRATERVMQLLTQAAGRAGRSSKRADPGNVMIQTFSPDNPIFDYLKSSDYLKFVEDELNIRQALGYPPFRRLILVMASSLEPARARQAIDEIKVELQSQAAENKIEILGPVESPIFKRGKLYRYQLLLKVPPEIIPADILGGITELPKKRKGISIRIDVDPVAFM